MNEERQVILENPELSNTRMRFVAYFDIMGFKNMIRTKPTDSIYGQFRDLLDDIQNKLKTHKLLAYSAFSDLIVVITDDDTSKAFTQLADAALMLMQGTFTRYGWGMSGCIAKGEITYDKNRNIFIGQPIVDAYLLSEDIDYYGVAVHKSAHDDVRKYITRKKREKKNSHLEFLFKEERIYFKNGFYSEYHLRWFDFDLVKKYDPQRTHKLIFKTLDNILKDIHGKARRYIENTKDVINYNQQ